VSGELVIEHTPFGLKAARLDHGRLLEVGLADGTSADGQGQIRLGRVRAIDRDLDAAFVDCGLDADAYLGARDARFLTDGSSAAPKRQGLRIDRLVREGQRVVVQVRQGSSGDKGPRVTGDVALLGCFVELHPRRRRASVSERLARTADAAAQRQRAAVLFPEAGITLRRAAAFAGDAELNAEHDRLRAQWRQIELAATATTTPARLDPLEDPLHRLLCDLIAPEVERIVVGDQATLVRARRWLAEWWPALADRLASLPDAFETTGVAEQLEEALRPEVPLAGGGSLIIQATAALTAIDVNGGGRRALEANLAATGEIARQLRLRRIGGTVVVDFIDLPSRSERERLLDALRGALADDPAPVQVSSMSRLGLVELSRKRTGASLAEALGRPCAACGGTGTLPGLRWRAERLMQELEGCRAVRLAVHAAPDLHGYLSGAGQADWQVSTRRSGRAVTLEVDAALAPGGHRIMELS
jgi:ribonuclease G